MKLKSTLAAVSAVLLASAWAPANAGTEVLYSNLSPSLSTGFDPTATLGPLFASFSTRGSNVTLSEIDLLLSAANPMDGDSFGVLVLTNNSGVPGTVLWQSAFSDSILSTTPTPEAFFPTLSLSADTRYWIGLTSPGSVQFESATSTAGIGVASEFYINSNGLVPNSDGPYQMLITATAPEPSTWVLMLAGFGSLGLAALRRARSRKDPHSAATA